MFTSSDKKTKLTGYGKHILLLFFKDFTQYFSLEQIRRFYSVVIVQVIDFLGIHCSRGQLQLCVLPKVLNISI